MKVINFDVLQHGKGRSAHRTAEVVAGGVMLNIISGNQAGASNHIFITGYRSFDHIRKYPRHCLIKDKGGRVIHGLVEYVDFVSHLIEKTRADHYYNLRGYFHGTQAESVEDIADDDYRRHTVVLAPECKTIGTSIEDLHLGEIGISILAVRRGSIRGEQPDPKMKLQQGDALILEGSAEELEQAEQILMRGT